MAPTKRQHSHDHTFLVWKVQSSCLLDAPSTTKRSAVVSNQASGASGHNACSVSTKGQSKAEGKKDWTTTDVYVNTLGKLRGKQKTKNKTKQKQNKQATAQQDKPRPRSRGKLNLTQCMFTPLEASTPTSKVEKEGKKEGKQERSTEAN